MTRKEKASTKIKTGEVRNTCSQTYWVMPATNLQEEDVKGRELLGCSPSQLLDKFGLQKAMPTATNEIRLPDLNKQRMVRHMRRGRQFVECPTYIYMDDSNICIRHLRVTRQSPRSMLWEFEDAHSKMSLV